MFAYLYATKEYGLTYWRPTPREDLPLKPNPKPITSYARLQEYDTQSNALQLRGSCDATWASNRLEQRSMGGVVMMLAGAAVYYRARLQPTVALSSTEAEFVNMTDAGKAALYIRWILEEIGLMQVDPTPILADNSGAIAIANAQKTTQRTRHVDIRAFIILQWTGNKFINFVQTPPRTKPVTASAKLLIMSNLTNIWM